MSNSSTSSQPTVAYTNIIHTHTRLDYLCLAPTCSLLAAGAIGVTLEIESYMEGEEKNNRINWSAAGIESRASTDITTAESNQSYIYRWKEAFLFLSRSLS